ncbi:MAG TPA: hypothetical protein DEP50_04975, partial [Acinetobacter lwoffii]|nr:hypothetical protein [Acinetobacter lwoffii]
SRVTLDRAASPKAMLAEQRRVKRCFTAAQDDELCSECTRLSRVTLDLSDIVAQESPIAAQDEVLCLQHT